MKKNVRKTIVSLTLVLTTLLGLAFAAPAQAAPTESVVCVQYHTVQRGENLFRIGRYYGLSVATLQQWNGIINPNRIYSGQALCVAQQVTPQIYVVQRGDRLSRLAQRFGVRMDVLAAVNGIANPNLIYVGQVLTIPNFTIQ